MTITPEPAGLAGPDTRDNARFVCPGCRTVFRSVVYCVTSGMYITCQHCKSLFQVELKVLGNFGELMKGINDARTKKTD